MDIKPQKDSGVPATVLEALPNALFKVSVDGEDGQILLTYLSGRMRINRIRVLIGDRVLVVKDPYGGKGRIVRRV